MNGLARDISMTFRVGGGFALAAAIAFGALACASPVLATPCDTPASVASDDAAARTAAASEIAGQAEQIGRTPGPYPDLCSIPPAPTDLRSPHAWATAVSDVNQAGAQTQADAAGRVRPA